MLPYLKARRDTRKLEASKAALAVTAANGTSSTDEGEILSSFRGKTVDFPRTRSYLSTASSLGSSIKSTNIF